MNLPLLTACCLITSAWGQGGHEAASGTGPDLCKDNITGVITCHFRDPRSEYKGQPGWNPEGTYDETSPYAVDPTQCKNGTCYVGYPGPCLYGFTSVENCMISCANASHRSSSARRTRSTRRRKSPRAGSSSHSCSSCPLLAISSSLPSSLHVAGVRNSSRSRR